MLNLDFDFRRYLDTLAADGLNHTRAFTGAYVEPQGAFNIARNTLAPRPDSSSARGRAATSRAIADGGNKFDLAQWDDAYFTRLQGLRRPRRQRGIVVELTLFCPIYEDPLWKLSPMNAANNVNGVGNVAPHGCLHPRQERRAARPCRRRSPASSSPS